MQIDGNIFEIVKSEKIWQIALKKRSKRGSFTIAFSAFGYKIEQLKELNLCERDKVRIKFTIESKMWNERYNTTLFISKIDMIEKYHGSANIFEEEWVDEETGEIFSADENE
jgi:hypothetical protein